MATGDTNDFYHAILRGGSPPSKYKYKDKKAETTTVNQMREFLNSKYVQEFQRAQQKLSEECVFKPDLAKSRKGVEPLHSRDPEAVFKRTIDWRDKSNKRIEHLRRAEEEKKKDPELTFKPQIKPMISERQYKQLSGFDETNSLPMFKKIPEDSQVSREAFMHVPGISKFLEKQFVAMCNKEEQAMMNFNMGKSRDCQKTIEEWIDPNFAYAAISQNT